MAWQSVTAIPGTSSSSTCTTGPASREPFLKGGLAFPGWFAGEEAFDTNIFVKFVPVNAIPSADRQLLRSADVAWTNRGNQASGTDKLLPSLNSMVSVSSVTVTDSATGTEISIVEVFIPRFPKTILMLGQVFINTVNFRT